MKVLRPVKFAYQPTPQTRELLSTFRNMVNDAIRTCLAENIKGRLKLRDRIYRGIQEKYGLVSRFPYPVAEVAWSIVKKHKHWHRKPFVRRLLLRMDAENFSLNHAILSLPFKKGQRILIPLQYGDYQRSFLIDTNLKRGSLTMTESSVFITFSKEVATTGPTGKIGFDLNEKSIVGSDGIKYDLSEVSRLHTLYGVRRSRFYKRHPCDRRLRQKFAGSRKERERSKQFLHRISALIVNKALADRKAIILERLKGIRYAHKRDNAESLSRRRRIALWPFRQLQSYIDNKARWAGVNVEYVSSSYTSKICSVCGQINRKLKTTERSWQCPCGAMLDRDLNAAINIERRGKTQCLGEIRPGARDRYEAVMGNPECRRQQVILGAEVPKPSLQVYK